MSKSRILTIPFTEESPSGMSSEPQFDLVASPGDRILRILSLVVEPCGDLDELEMCIGGSPQLLVQAEGDIEEADKQMRDSVARLRGVDPSSVISFRAPISGKASGISSYFGSLEGARRKALEGSTDFPGLLAYPILISPNCAFLRIGPGMSRIKGAVLVCEVLADER